MFKENCQVTSTTLTFESVCLYKVQRSVSSNHKPQNRRATDQGKTALFFVCLFFQVLQDKRSTSTALIQQKMSFLFIHWSILLKYIMNCQVQLCQTGCKYQKMKDFSSKSKMLDSWPCHLMRRGVLTCFFLSRLLLLLQARGSSWQPYCSRGFWEERIFRQLHHQGPSEPSGPHRPQEECDAFHCMSLSHCRIKLLVASSHKNGAAVVGFANKFSA